MTHCKNLNLDNLSEIIDGVLYDELWDKINQYENYMISTFGRVKSLHRVMYDSRYNKKHTFNDRILKLCFDKDGYLQARLFNKDGSKTKRVHQLVAKAFIHNPQNKPEPNHENGIKTDNRSVNISWVTKSENIQHSFDRLARKSAWGGKSGILNKDSKKIKCIENNKVYFSLREAERELKISSANISRVCSGQRISAGGLTFSYC